MNDNNTAFLSHSLTTHPVAVGSATLASPLSRSSRESFIAWINSALAEERVKDARFSNAAFAEKNGLTFPILSDYTRSTVEAYGVALHDFADMPGYTASERAVFIVDEDGDVMWKWVGENPGIEPDYDAVLAAVGA